MTGVPAGTRTDTAYLGAGVHEDKVLAVEPQEDGPREAQPAHFEHHIHSVAKEGQLGRGLCGRNRARLSLLSSGTYPTLLCKIEASSPPAFTPSPLPRPPPGP